MEANSERVAIFMAWPYANGPLHLGHVAGNCLPADIQYKYERARGRKVLMCSGSDEHGTPITLTAEQEGISPQEVVDRFHNICLLYTSPSPRDRQKSRMPSSA